MNKKIFGDPKKINLSTSSFEKIRNSNYLYVDKTKFIENFLNEPNDVQLIVRQRRLGKSLNLDTLRCFLTDKEDNRHLFEGTYIENSQLWYKLNRSPVFYLILKTSHKKDIKKKYLNKLHVIFLIILMFISWTAFIKCNLRATLKKRVKVH